MTYENKDKTVNVVRWGLILGGMWPREVSEKPLIRYINYVWSILARFIFCCFYFGLSTECIRLIVQKYEIEEIIASASVVITSTKIAVIIVIYYKNNVLQILDEVTKKEAEIWKENNPEIIKLFTRKLKMGTFFSVALWVLVGVTVSSVNVSGVFGSRNLILYNEANNASIESHFLYKFYFPADRLVHYKLVTVISCILSFEACVYNCTTNMIVVILCIHAATHLSILQHRLRNYIPEDFKEEQMDETVLTLTGLVIQHRYLIDFTTYVNDCCKNIIMMEFILTSVDVAMAALNLLKMNVSDLGWLVFYLPMLVLQIYSIAWSANEVNIQSQAVGDAAYESKWYVLNRQGKMLTQLMIQRARERPLIMTIGPFGPMTMETFLMIMKAAYSYVSIMRK